MRLARADVNGTTVQGQIEDGGFRTDDELYEFASLNLRAPCEPGTIYCIGRNFTETADQMGYDLPDEPDFFIKPRTAVLDPEAPIEYPHFTDELTYAGELAAVIGKQSKDISEDDVADIVVGYTILNDLDALDQFGRTARKAFDGSAPLGPWIETDIEPDGIEMETIINEERRQSANTDQMIFGPREIVSYLSSRVTLFPGDVISFGSPANPGLIHPGDRIEITYDGIGTLSNDVKSPN